MNTTYSVTEAPNYVRTEEVDGISIHLFRRKGVFEFDFGGLLGGLPRIDSGSNTPAFVVTAVTSGGCYRDLFHGVFVEESFRASLTDDELRFIALHEMGHLAKGPSEFTADAHAIEHKVPKRAGISALVKGWEWVLDRETERRNPLFYEEILASKGWRGYTRLMAGVFSLPRILGMLVR